MVKHFNNREKPTPEHYIMLECKLPDIINEHENTLLFDKMTQSHMFSDLESEKALEAIKADLFQILDKCKNNVGNFLKTCSGHNDNGQMSSVKLSVYLRKGTELKNKSVMTINSLTKEESFQYSYSRKDEEEKLNQSRIPINFCDNNRTDNWNKPAFYEDSEDESDNWNNPAFYEDSDNESDNCNNPGVYEDSDDERHDNNEYHSNKKRDN